MLLGSPIAPLHGSCLPCLPCPAASPLVSPRKVKRSKICSLPPTVDIRVRPRAREGTSDPVHVHAVRALREYSAQCSMAYLPLAYLHPTLPQYSHVPPCPTKDIGALSVFLNTEPDCVPRSGTNCFHAFRPSWVSACTPWDTLLLALVGGGVDGPIWVCRANKCSYPRETPIEAQGEYRWLDGSQIVQRHWDWLQTASAAVPFPAASLWEVAACPPHTYVPTTQHNLNQVSAPAP